MAGWRRMKNLIFLCCAVMSVLYMAFCTSELYDRLQKNRKYQRLLEYEKELSDLSSMMEAYKKEASQVERSLRILREAFATDAASIQQEQNINIVLENR